MPLVQRQADSGKITVSESEPATPLKGDLWYDTDDNELFSYNGSAFVGIGHAADETQTLTNKTLALGSNTISGTLAQLNTAVTNASVASLTGTETLTNKTIGTTQLTLSTDAGLAKLELLDTYTATSAENNYSLDSVSFDSSDYVGFIIKISGKTTATGGAITMQLNGITSSAFYRAYYNRITSAPASAVVGSSATALDVLSNTALTGGANEFGGEIVFILEPLDGFLHGFKSMGCRPNLTWEQGGIFTNGDVDPITSIDIDMTTTTWQVGTQINVYGLRP